MSRWVRRGMALGTAMLWIAGVGCLSGRSIQSPAASNLVFDSDPQAVRVQMARQPSAPLTVDWSMQDRKSLEARVHQKGAIVVRFDDKKLEPLPDCRPTGSYVFSGVTHGRELIDARTTAELAANFPLTSLRIGAHYAEAEQISADLHIVGMANLDRPRITRSEVVSGPCSGATHIVTEITHGGFRFGSARALGGGLQAEGVGLGAAGGTAATASRLSEDGDIAACKRATWKDPEPPASCGGVVRIRLVPIDGEKDDATCPPGLRWTGSGCASEQIATKAAPPPPADLNAVDVGTLKKTEESSARSASFTCDPTRPGECYTQCLAGNAESCSHLGVAFAIGQGVAKNEELGLKLLDLACDRGSSDGCLQAGALLMDKKQFAQAHPYSTRSCEMGNPGGCTNEAYTLWRGLGGVRADPTRAFELFARACNRRDFVSCNNAGVMLMFDTTGTLKRNPSLACKMFGQSCEAGQSTSCANAGICIEHGIDQPQNAELAFKQYATACDAGSAFGCVWGALLLETSARGNPKALRAALQQYEKSCLTAAPNVNSCVSKVDIKTALPGRYSDDLVDRHACDGGSAEGLACYNAGLVHERGLVDGPNPRRASELFRRGCNELDMKKACRAAR